MTTPEVEIAFRREVERFSHQLWSCDLVSLWFNETEPHPLATPDHPGFPPRPATRQYIVEQVRARFGPHGANICADLAIMKLH
jgi:hypothetical protein